MLHLLPSVLSKKIHAYFSARRIFLGELLFFVFCSHVVLFGLVILFSSLQSKQEQFSISLHQSGQTYVLMPLSKKVFNASSPRSKKSDSAVYKKSKVIDYQAYQKHKKAKQHKKNVVKKNATKLVEPKKNLSKQNVNHKQKESKDVDPVEAVTVQEKPALADRAPKKNVQEKKASLQLKASSKKQKNIKAKPVDKDKKAVSMKKKTVVAQSVLPVKKTIEQKFTPLSKAEVSKLDVPKVDTHTADLPAKQKEVVAVEAIPVVAAVADVAAQDTAATLALDNPNVQPVGAPLAAEEQVYELDEINLEDVVFLGQEQFDNSVVASKLKQAVEQCWNPPVGIKPGTSCLMRVHINAQGKADYVKVVQSSKILMYDSPARKALFAMQYPVEVWNKTISIALGV